MQICRHTHGLIRFTSLISVQSLLKFKKTASCLGADLKAETPSNWPAVLFLGGRSVSSRARFPFVERRRVPVSVLRQLSRWLGCSVVLKTGQAETHSRKKNGKGSASIERPPRKR